MNDDIITACADLVGRAGAREFEIGHIHDDVPVEEAGWYAHATYQGARIQAQDHRSPTAAALALAERILSGGLCRCGRTVTLSDGQPGSARVPMAAAGCALGARVRRAADPDGQDHARRHGRDEPGHAPPSRTPPMSEYRGRVTKQPPLNVTPMGQAEPEYLPGGWKVEVYTSGRGAVRVVDSTVAATQPQAFKVCCQLIRWFATYGEYA